jgi:hypothetical protein
MATPENDGNAEYGGPLPPHPLICGLAVGVAHGDLEKANQAAAYSLSLPPVKDATEPNSMSGDLEVFPRPHRPQVVVFAGYLGPSQTDKTDPYPDHHGSRTWRLLYQDAKAMSWLMVPEKAIVLHYRCEDDNAAFRLRDYIWVRADAPVRQGTQEESEQARFLVGTFTNAGDLHDSLIDASTTPAGSGILCAPTPECCPYHRTP